MYGREARLPIDISLQATREDHDNDLETKVERMLEMQKKLHENALANIEKAQSNQKQQYDAKHNTRTKLKVGDNVLVESKKNEGRKGGKLEIKFKGGPYTIAKDVGKGRFRLRDAQGNMLKTAINCHCLKIWHDLQASRLNQRSVSYYNHLSYNGKSSQDENPQVKDHSSSETKASGQQTESVSYLNNDNIVWHTCICFCA